MRHTPPARFTPKQAARVERGKPMRRAGRLYYRHVNQAERWESVELRDGAAAIPASYTDSPYPLQYYFEFHTAPDQAWLYPGLCARPRESALLLVSFPEALMNVIWRGVFPALTTQFHDDQSLDIAATARHLETMIEAGIHGVVLLGTVGENTALEYEEKLTVVREMLAVVARPDSGADRRRRVHDRARLPVRARCREARHRRADGAARHGLQIGRARDHHALPHHRRSPPGCRS